MKSSDDDFSVFQRDRDYEKSILGEPPKREFGRKLRQKHYEHKILKSGGSKRNSLKDRDLSRNKKDSAAGRFLAWRNGLTPQGAWAFKYSVYGTIAMIAAMIILYRVDGVLSALAFTAGIVYYFIVYFSCSGYTTYYKLHNGMIDNLVPFNGFNRLAAHYLPIVFDGKKTVRMIEVPSGVMEFTTEEIIRIKEIPLKSGYTFYIKDREPIQLQVNLAIEEEVEEVVKKILGANEEIEFTSMSFSAVAEEVKEKLKKFTT